ncbi:MAG: hypothetical protein JSS84_02655 [Bacteroidetes bacterium]|nr:hypothetical protein [Bacteroidota bacterium]
MSDFHLQTIPCPFCSHEQQTTVWSSVNSRDEKAMKLLRAMLINRFQCEACGKEAFMEADLLYHDMERKFLIQYVSQESMKNPKFYRNITKQGTMILDPISSTIMDKTGGEHFRTPHYVFSLGELVLYLSFRDLCGIWGQD